MIDTSIWMPMRCQHCDEIVKWNSTFIIWVHAESRRIACDIADQNGWEYLTALPDSIMIILPARRVNGST